MLPEAVLPPSEDHIYAQWLEREEAHSSPQLSPYKRVAGTPYKTAYAPAHWEGGSPVLSPQMPLDDIRKCGFCGELGDRPDNVRAVIGRKPAVNSSYSVYHFTTVT